MKIHRNVASLLKRAGATFIRRSKHYIFELPNGKRLTVSGTPSDRYAVTNQMREIKQLGGLDDEKRKNPDRVEKHGRSDAAGRRVTRDWLGFTAAPIPSKPSLSQQLSSSGIVERALRTEVSRLESELKLKNAVIVVQEDRIIRLRSWHCPCLICRLKRRFHARKNVS